LQLAPFPLCAEYALLEKSLAGGVDFDAAVQQLLTEVIAEHGAVVFNGEWRERCRRSS